MPRQDQSYTQRLELIRAYRAHGPSTIRSCFGDSALHFTTSIYYHNSVSIGCAIPTQ